MKFNIHDLFNRVEIPDNLSVESKDINEIEIRRKIYKRIKSDIKARKRRIAIILIAAILLLATVAFGASRMDFFKNYFRSIDEIELKINNNRGHSFQLESGELVKEKPFKIDDKKVLNKISEFLTDARYPTEKEKEKYIGSEDQYKNRVNFNIKEENGEVNEVKGYFDAMVGWGYFNYKGEDFVLNYDFFSFIDKLILYSDTMDMNIPKDSGKLLEKNGWKMDMLVNRQKTVLPERFEMNLDTKPYEYYYIFMNELSKNSGYDYSKYAGKEVDVESISLNYKIGKEYYYNMGGYPKAVIIKYEGKIVGAFIENSVDLSSSESIGHKNIKQILKKDAHEWFNENYNFEDSKYNEYKNLSQEEVVRKYVEAEFKLDLETNKLLRMPSFRNNIIESFGKIIVERNEVPVSGAMTWEDIAKEEGHIDKNKEAKIVRIDKESDDPVYGQHYIITTEGFSMPAGSGGVVLGVYLKNHENLGWKVTTEGF